MFFARENAPMPYTMPKLTALARLRIIGVTICSGMWNTCAAVILWMSSSCKKASIIFWSFATCANTRSSIWE